MPLLPEPVTVSNVLSRRINARGYKTMSAPIAACLLCLLIVGASLDRLPDPPAVKPQGNLNTLVSQLHSQVPFAARNHASDYLAFHPHFQASLFSFVQFLLGRGHSYDLTFVNLELVTSLPYLSSCRCPG